MPLAIRRLEVETVCRVRRGDDVVLPRRQPRDLDELIRKIPCIYVAPPLADSHHVFEPIRVDSARQVAVRESIGRRLDRLTRRGVVTFAQRFGIDVRDAEAHFPADGDGLTATVGRLAWIECEELVLREAIEVEVSVIRVELTAIDDRLHAAAAVGSVNHLLDDAETRIERA